MRILLTGATGFIGSAVLKLAVSQNHEVAALVRPGKTLSATRLLVGTLERAPWNEIAAFGPEVCIHTAWITTPRVYLDSPENERLEEWSELFIRKAVACGVGRVVALGTCIEYKMTGKILSEEMTPLAPATRYARCKDSLRCKLDQAARADGFSFSWARVFYPYGPGEHPARLASSAINEIRRGETLELKNGDSVKDYIFIDDLAAAILAVATGDTHGAINLATGVGVPVGEVARTIAELLGRPELIREITPAVPDPFSFVVADVRRLHTLGWQPRVTLREGLQQLIQSQKR